MAFILGIETSCDDTSICLLEGDPKGLEVKDLHFFEQFSHEKILAKWGGVVPEIAARNHLEKLGPLLETAFQNAPVAPKDLDAIAVTTHPGLLGPLLTGLSGAKTLALLHRLPLIGVNHLYAHLEAVHLDQRVDYPYLGLLISGGHSLFFLVHSSSRFEVLGTTVDDAAGEAFDKGGRLLGLAYPAGPAIDRLAHGGDESRYPFPIGLKDTPGCELSFSGLKSALRTFLLEHPGLRERTLQKDFSGEIKDLLASYQWAIVKALSLKLHQAIKKVGSSVYLPIVVGGGVACNTRLRGHLQKEFPSDKLHFVSPRFCTDNGAMIAHFGLRRFHERLPFPQCLSLDAGARFKIRETE
ncbi:MAG: tRNA (adenosine(37)-N6)-threonylcarbamoyltransferase complex transferase subunit TsaD [Bacteriovoracales bacterium]|nr:tRNA (adenosine(37)-N6)-threonylcarbamoyltransferase complex transferase subunit TsaD [Bacteriovoracales bacterium]